MSVTLGTFCRNEYGELLWWAEWTHTPFRVANRVAATNGHILVWRTARPEDVERPRLGRTRAARVLSLMRLHPGRLRCCIPWPDSAPVEIDGFECVFVPMKNPYAIQAIYRDRVARFGLNVGAPVLYARPRTPRSEHGKHDPLPFVVGPYSGLLMPIHTDWEKAKEARR